MNCILTVLYLLTIAAEVLCNAVGKAEDEDYSRYAYNYAANDPLFKGAKIQGEERYGDIINGGYPILGPDGSLRSLVDYKVDEFNEFTAILKSLAASLSKPLPHVDPLPFRLPQINPLIDPLTYGLGAAPLAVGVPKVTVSGSSIPWDPKTRSYGGWVPLRKSTRKLAYAKIVTKKYVNGNVYKVMSKPIPLTGKRIILKRRPQSD